jgi:hypothetical protein
MDYRIAIATMDAMWEEIAEDGAEQYKPDLIGEFWIGIYADGDYVGMYRIHQLTSALWQGHTFTLPDKREHSFGAGKAIFEWTLENIPDMRKMIVEVPECFPNVIGFVKKLGFEEQGYNSDSYSKNGIIGVYQLGITADKMAKQVEKWQQQQQ